MEEAHFIRVARRKRGAGNLQNNLLKMSHIRYTLSR